MTTCLRGLFSLVCLRRLLAGGVLLYVGTSLTLGGTPAAKPVFQSLTAIWLLVIAFRQWRHTSAQLAPPGRFAQLGRMVEIIATNLALTILLAEGSLRGFSALAGTSLVVADTLDAHRLVAGRDYGGGLHGNRLGYPGRDFERGKRAGVRRIAALGDSFAVGPAVRFADNYLTLLETKLPGSEVYNFGVSGTGPREYLAILRREVWTYQPDLVLLSVFVGNDVTEILATPRHMDPRQSALYLLLTRGWRLLQEQCRQNDTKPVSFTGRLPPRGLSPEAFREVEGRRLALCLTPPPPGLEKKWQRALADLEGIINDCRRRGVPLAVVLIPDEFQVNPAVLDLALPAANVTRAAVDLQLPQRRLAAFFARRGVPCLDLLPVFTGATQTYALRDTHWNERGNHLAARAISRWHVAQRFAAKRLAADTNSLK